MEGTYMDEEALNVDVAGAVVLSVVDIVGKV